MNPLSQAARRGDILLLKSRIKGGVEINEVDEWGYSALTHACHQGRIDAARILLEAGADANVRKNYDTFHTPLSIAAFRGHFEVVKLLVAQGADISIYAGIWQVRAECYARKQGHHHISEYLEYATKRNGDQEG